MAGIEMTNIGIQVGINDKNDIVRIVVVVEAKAEFVKEAAADCIYERELSSKPGLNDE